MKPASIAFAVIALATGLIAAWNWYKSSKVTIDPGWGLPGTGGYIEPVLQGHKQLDMDAATIRGFDNSSSLNKVASLWTAASVLAGGMSSILGALSS